jgi:hypothetical protein
MQYFVRRTSYVPSRGYWGDVRREFMQRFSAALHGTLGSYLRDALHEVSVDAMACLNAFIFLGLRFFPLHLLLAWRSLMLLLIRISIHLSRIQNKPRSKGARRRRSGAGPGRGWWYPYSHAKTGTVKG